MELYLILLFHKLLIDRIIYMYICILEIIKYFEKKSTFLFFDFLKVI